MNKKLMIAMVVIGMSALYVRFQVIGMESEGLQARRERMRRAAEQRRDGGAEPRVQEAELSAAAPRAEDAVVSTGPSAGIVKQNLKQMWEYEISKKIPFPPKVMAFLYHKLCVPNRLLSLQYDAWVNSVAFSPDGRRLATGSDDRTVIIWDVQNGNRLQTLQCSSGSVNSVAFSPDGMKLAAGLQNEAAVIWDVNNWNRQTLQCNGGSVYSVAFSPDGTKLATGSGDRTAIIWDVASGNRDRILQSNRRVYSVAFSPDGTKLATGSGDKTAVIWNVQGWNALQRLECENVVKSVSFSPDGMKLATGTIYGTVLIWDVGNGDMLRILSCPRTDIYSVAFSPDGRKLATGSDDRTVIIWDVENGDRLQILPCDHVIESVSFSPDGTKLATGSIRTTVIWDVGCFKEVDRLIRDLKTNYAQFGLMRAFEETFENRRGIGKIQATPEQWATFLTLPQEVQEILRVRIKSPYERAVFTSPSWKPVRRPGEHMRRIIEEQGSV